MTQERQSVTAAHARISYPVFTEEAAPAVANEMNRFYEALCEALVAYAEGLNSSHEGGMRMLMAEYRAETDGTRTTVEYQISVRRRGRTEGRQRLLHTWEGGALVMPARKPPVLWKWMKRWIQHRS